MQVLEEDGVWVAGAVVAVGEVALGVLVLRGSHFGLGIVGVDAVTPNNVVTLSIEPVLFSVALYHCNGRCLVSAKSRFSRKFHLRICLGESSMSRNSTNPSVARDDSPRPHCHG